MSSSLELIAQKAGVSKMTVSRILRNFPNHNPETREKVLKIAAELNYRKNPLITALMTTLRHKRPANFRTAIALIQCDPLRKHTQQNRLNLRNGIQIGADLQGFEVETFRINEAGMTPERLVQMITSRGIGCMIFEPFPRGNIQLDINLEPFSAISVSASLKTPRLNRVEIDHISGFGLAVEKLKERGYNRFGFLADPLSLTSNEDRRRAAFLLGQDGLLAKDKVPQLSFSPEDSQRKPILEKWLKKYQPEVIISSLDSTITDLNELGYSIPDDLGYIHLGLSDNTGPISGVNPNWLEVGISAANQVIETLVTNNTGAPLFPRHTYIQPIWVEGETLPQRF